MFLKFHRSFLQQPVKYSHQLANSEPVSVSLQLSLGISRKIGEATRELYSVSKTTSSRAPRVVRNRIVDRHCEYKTDARLDTSARNKYSCDSKALTSYSVQCKVVGSGECTGCNVRRRFCKTKCHYALTYRMFERHDSCLTRKNASIFMAAVSLADIRRPKFSRVLAVDAKLFMTFRFVPMMWMLHFVLSCNFHARKERSVFETSREQTSSGLPRNRFAQLDYIRVYI